MVAPRRRLFAIQCPSRTPVNLALSRRYAEGLVSYSEHLGFFVRELTAQELIEIYDLRLMCELHAVTTGLPDASAKHIERIAAIEEEISASTDWADGEAFRRFWELDGEFHRQIVRLSPNDQLQQWFARLNHHLHGARLGLLARRAHPFELMVREHHAIVEALRSRDVSLAQEELRRHITRSRDVSLERLAAALAAAPPDAARDCPI